MSYTLLMEKFWNIKWRGRKIYIRNGVDRLNSSRPSDAYMRQWINHHWFRLWLVACSAPNHYLKQGWNHVNWEQTSVKYESNLYIFIQENAFGNVVYDKRAILPMSQRVNVAEPFACTSIIKFPPAWFAQNPFRGHTSSTMFAIVVGVILTLSFVVHV